MASGHAVDECRIRVALAMLLNGNPIVQQMLTCFEREEL